MRLFSLKFWIAALAAAVFFLGCARSQPPAEESYRVIGRHVQTAPGQYQMGWPGSGVTAAFQGTTLSAEITDDGNGIMDVTVNDIEGPPIYLKAGTHRYTIVNKPKVQNLFVDLTRRTEVFDTGLFTLANITADGPYLPTQAPQRRILFVGDSITAGFGVRGDTKDCDYAPSTNAPTQSYAWLAAKALNAPPHLIAISGRGVVHNWDANPAPVMPAQIDFALPDHAEAGNWEHAQFVPDVIVTTLGTNDWSVIDPGKDRFRAGYRDMLKGLRARFPKAHIASAGGPLLGGEKGAAIRDGINWAHDDLRDENMSAVDFTLAQGGFKWSCLSHPGRDSMKVMANRLAQHIADKTGWMPALINIPILPPENMPPDGKRHFAKRVSEIDALPILEGEVLLAGDSITEGWRNHAAIFPTNIISNHGVGWDTTEGLLARLPQILRHNPKAIFILIGTNDLSFGRSADAIISDLSETISRLKNEKPEAEIFVQSVLPRETQKRSAVANLNMSLQALAAEQGVIYVDLTTNFAAKDGSLRAELTDDGLHLNAAGYAVWAKALRPYIP